RLGRDVLDVADAGEDARHLGVAGVVAQPGDGLVDALAHAIDHADPLDGRHLLQQPSEVVEIAGATFRGVHWSPSSTIHPRARSPRPLGPASLRGRGRWSAPRALPAPAARGCRRYSGAS